MNIITVSRQFGSGGRELGKRLADLLGYDYYDREIIEAIAKNKSLDVNYVQKALSTSYVKSVPITFGRTIMPAYDNSTTELLVEERRVIEEIATQGRDFIIVGRNADVILEKLKPFNVFVCANMEARVQRCLLHLRDDEVNDTKAMEKSIKRIDKARIRTREIITDKEWGEPCSYHVVLNTTGKEIKALAKLLANFLGEHLEK